jgi:intergrase/recombinase
MQNLIKKRDNLLSQLVESGGFIKGSITAVCGTCGRANCICTEKPKAKAYRLTYKDGKQKTQIVYIPKKRLAEMRRATANYARMRKLIERITQLNIAIFKEE